MTSKKSENRLLEMFLLYFPFEADHVVRHKEVSPFDLYIEMDDGRRVMYNDENKAIRRLPKDDKRLTESQFKNEFAIRLRNIMLRKGITQSELARQAGIKQSQVSNYLTNRNTPSFYVVDKIAKVLDCSVDELTYRV